MLPGFLLIVVGALVLVSGVVTMSLTAILFGAAALGLSWLELKLVAGVARAAQSRVFAAGVRLAARGWRRRPARLLGSIVPGPTFTAAVTGRRAVLARMRVRPQTGAEVDETRAVPFHVAVAGGELVRVETSHVFLVDPPEGWRPYPHLPLPAGSGHLAEPGVSASFAESSLAPGDRVEVSGVVEERVEPDAPHAPGRGTPMRRVVVGTAEAPVLVRRTWSRRRPGPGPGPLG